MTSDEPFRLRDIPGGMRQRQYDGVQWDKPFSGVRVGAGRSSDVDVRIRSAALLLPPSGAIGGWAAARLHGSAWAGGRDELGRHRPIPVVVPPPAHIREREGLAVSRSDLDHADVVRLGDLRVPSPARTAFDLARSGQVADTLGEVDALLRATGLSAADAGAYADAHRRWKGRPRAIEVLGLADPRAESPPESWLRLEWLRAGLPRPLVNPDVFNLGGFFLGRPDLLDVEAAVAVEYDGDHHRERATFRKDVTRGRTFGDHNLIVVRVTGADRHRPERLHASMRAAWARGMARDRSLDRWSLDGTPFWIRQAIEG